MSDTPTTTRDALKASLREKLHEHRNARRGAITQPGAQVALLNAAGDNALAMQVACSVLKHGKLQNPFGTMPKHWADDE